jgi:hypothetical protein
MDISALKSPIIGKRINEAIRNKFDNYQDFADAIHTSRTNVYDIIKRSTIDSDLLFSISLVTEHNFFAELSDEVNEAIAEKQREKARKEALGTGTGRYGNTLGFQTYNTFDMVPPKFPSIESISGSSKKNYDNCTEEEIMKSYQKYMSLF